MTDIIDKIDEGLTSTEALFAGPLVALLTSLVIPGLSFTDFASSFVLGVTAVIIVAYYIGHKKLG